MPGTILTVKSAETALSKKQQAPSFLLYKLSRVFDIFFSFKWIIYCTGHIVSLLGMLDLVSSVYSTSHIFSVMWMCLLFRSINDMKILLSYGMSCFGLVWCIRKRYIDVPVAFAIAVMCDKSAQVILLSLLLIIICQMLKALSNATDAGNTTIIPVLTLLNAVVLSISFMYDLAAATLYKEYSPEVSEYSFFFQTSLDHFYFPKTYFSVSEDKDEPLVPTDRYVIDRSLVRIINIKHKKFLSVSQSEGKYAPEQNYTFEIQKIFTQEETGEVNRYLGNGDFVRIVNPSTNEALGPVEEESSTKLKDTYFGSHSEERDLWVIECDEEEVEARKTVFRLRHYKTGMMLGCHSVKGSVVLSASVYSDTKSRDFIIADNTNHPYFKETLNQEKAKESTLEFQPLPFSDMLWEHLSVVFGKKVEYKYRQSIVILSFSVSVCFTFFTMLMRYLPFTFCTKLVEETPAVSIMFLFLSHILLSFASNLPFTFCLSVTYNSMMSTIYWHKIGELRGPKIVLAKQVFQREGGVRRSKGKRINR